MQIMILWLLFQFLFLLTPSLVLLFELRHQALCWIGMEKVEILVIFLILMKMLWVLFWMTLVAGFLYIAFIMLKFISCTSSSTRTLSWMDAWFCQRSFSITNEMTMWFLFLNLYFKLCLLLYLCWTIPISLGWILFHQERWHFWCFI